MLSGIIAAFFVIGKYLDSHFIQKTETNTKTLIRDCVVAYLASFLAFYIKDYIGDTKEVLKGPTPAYTGEATF